MKFSLTKNKKRKCFVVKTDKHEVEIDFKLGFSYAVFCAIRELKRKEGIVPEQIVKKKRKYTKKIVK